METTPPCRSCKAELHPPPGCSMVGIHCLGQAQGARSLPSAVPFWGGSYLVGQGPKGAYANSRVCLSSLSFGNRV